MSIANFVLSQNCGFDLILGAKQPRRAWKIDASTDGGICRFFSTPAEM
jgi:hypothetical protein